VKKLHRYEGKGITLTYDARRCTHVGECVRGLPAVFDPARRPWVVPDEADPVEVTDVVRRWPTGALHFERAGTPTETPARPNTVTVSSDGPLILRGDLRIGGADDATPETRAALCGEEAHPRWLPRGRRLQGSLTTQVPHLGFAATKNGQGNVILIAPG